MRPYAPLAALTVASVLASRTALTDPLPVHTATTRIAHTSLQAQERLALADEVARVLSASGIPDVFTATDTRNRLQEINPSGLWCDSASCATGVSNPIRGRALILVTQSRTRGRVAIEIQYINLRGEPVQTVSRDEPIGSWNEAIAIARQATEQLITRLPDDARHPAVGPDPHVVTAPDPRVVTAPDPHVVTAPDPHHDGVVAPPALPEVRYVRRPWEIGVGAGAIAGGLALAVIGSYNIATNGSVTPVAGNREEYRCAAGGSTTSNRGREDCSVGVVSPVLLGVGIVAIGGGIFLLIDGLRRRPEVVPAAPPRPALRVGGAPLAQGGIFTLSGSF